MTKTLKELEACFAPSTREEFETALDSHKLYVMMSAGNFWELRRNGRTQTWKTRPNDFRTPMKYGLRGTTAFTQDDLGQRYFRIAGSTL